MTVAGFLTSACTKKESQENSVTVDSTHIQNNYPDSASTASPNSQDSLTDRDSINTKTHIGGRKTSNNNTGNSTGNINAAVSDSAHPKR
ncbi:hypothetical protein DRF59_11350 [Chryseobacterium flavum]|uniref:Uncharacterized protein n=2 Tax=Chryseobacterium flavum TaxID=415851 RepID=A0A3D9CMB8_9FLAO|nr:hypothetical protein DRF59_11350 [Chryseobacterium flavum]